MLPLLEIVNTIREENTDDSVGAWLDIGCWEQQLHHLSKYSAVHRSSDETRRVDTDRKSCEAN